MTKEEYSIVGNFETVKNSTWKPEENKICLDFQKYFLRPAMERIQDKSPAPFFYVTLAKDVELPNNKFKKGERLKAVFASRMGDISLTRNLTATGGYELRLDPYDSETLISISKEV